MHRRIYILIGLITFFGLAHITVPHLDLVAIIDFSVTAILFVLYEFLLGTAEKRERKKCDELLKGLGDELGKLKSSFPIFVENFSNYCIECKKAIEIAEDDCEIFTIQTPLYVDEVKGGEKDFETYIKSTAIALLKKNNHSNSPKIRNYKRLIVINDVNDNKEIEQEKKKLSIFVETIYKELDSWNDPLKPTLINVQIGLIKSIDIHNSPFSNLDILLIKNSHLVVAFPKEDNMGYIWGSSIHFEKNQYIQKFVEQIPTFENIYLKAWNNPNSIKIKFGDIHNPRTLGTSETDLKVEIEKAFKKLIS